MSYIINILIHKLSVSEIQFNQLPSCVCGYYSFEYFDVAVVDLINLIDRLYRENADGSCELRRW